MRTVAAGVVLLLAAVSGCSQPDAAPAEVGPLASGSETPSLETPVPSDGDTRPTRPLEESHAGPAASGDASSPTTATGELDASAFVRRFFEVINDAYVRRDAANVRRLSTPDCGSCAAVAGDIDRLAAERHSVGGRRYIVSTAAAAPARPDGRVVVDFQFDADPYVERDSLGTLILQHPAEQDRDGQVLVVSSPKGFRISAIRLVDQ